MAISITSIDPGRGRAGDTGVDINGSGFSATPGQNTVSVDGQAATVTADSATQVTITIPGGITTDQHVDVQITNDDTGESATRKWWSKLAAATLDTVDLPGQIPGPFEIVGTEQADIAEAKDYERLVTLVERVRGRVSTVTREQNNYNSNQTLTDDSDEVAIVDTSGGGVTINLPSGPSAGRRKWVKNETAPASANDCIVDGNGNNIDGSSQVTLKGHDAILAEYDSAGGQWVIL